MSCGTTVGAANSPYPNVKVGIEQYLSYFDISPSKVVLGIPWYGYDYPCINTTSKSRLCSVVTPFGGGAWQFSYKDILVNKLPLTTTGLMWDSTSLSPFFNYENSSGDVHQVWFDNPESLTYKYEYAKSVGLRGVGFWTADFLDYGGHGNPKNPVYMWDAISSFF